MKGPRVLAAAAAITLATAVAGAVAVGANHNSSGSSAGRATTTSHQTVPTTTTAPSGSTTTIATGPATTVAGPLGTTTTTAVPSPFLPNLSLHPGEIDTALGTAQLCAPGFSTSSIRPPVSYTDHLKRLELGGGGSITGPSGTTYSVVGEHLPGTLADYELDHLISLEIGGNPEDPRNLWMEPWQSRGAHLAPAGLGAEAKDVIENRLHREVCAGTITLVAAQAEIASDWETAH